MVTQIPELPVQISSTKASEQNHGHQVPELTMKQWQEKLFEELDPSGLESWPPDLAVAIWSLLAEYHDVFSLKPGELGCTYSMTHGVKVTNDTPFKEWFTWIPLPLVEEVWMHLWEMLDSGAIHPSQSMWCNAVVLVQKKDGGLHFCIDFWCLNAQTKKDSYPLPIIQEALESLVGAGYFFCLDLKSRSWQIKMDESLRQNTKLTIGSVGFFKCDCMPFRLCNAPATFQWLMQNCLGELNLIYCLIYLDDIVVFSCTAEEHLHHLHVIFDQFREHNLKLKLLKCNFLRRKLPTCYIKSQRWEYEPANWMWRQLLRVQCLIQYTEVHAFLGLVGQYRRFIKGFACIAQPLNNHLTGEGTSRKSESVSLSEDYLKAFEALKEACMTAPMLAFTDYSKPFLLETDASKNKLGAVLSQKQVDGWYHPITYGSRALMPHAKNYHLTKFEFLALKWVVTEHFKEYLLYQPFLLKTDNNPLTYIMMTPNLDATGNPWIGVLAHFNFEMEYQKGCNNTVVDVLSQVTIWLDPDMVKSILNGVAIGVAHWVETHDPTVVESDHCLEQEVHVATGCAQVQMHVMDGVKAQREDLALSAVLDWLGVQKKTDLKAPLANHAPSEEGWLILWNHQNFMIYQGALYLHLTPKGETEDLLLFVIPKAHQVTALNGCHRGACHQGHDCTLSLLREHFWWSGMISRVQQSIKNCICCLQHEGNLSKVPLHLTVATASLDLLHINFTSIETTMELNQLRRVANVLVFQDHFTKHIMVYVTPDQTAKTVTKSLYQGYISIFGALARLLSDQGANFMSSIIDEMCTLLSMKKLQTTPYHPQTNGLMERSHQTIIQMIRKWGEDKKADWPGHLAEIMQAYNATWSAMLGYSPHCPMFGHRPWLPVNFYFPTFRSTEVPMRGTSARCVDKYVATVHDWLRATLREAQTQSTAETQWQKLCYDQKIGTVYLKPCDLVLVKANDFKGKRKIKDGREDGTCEVEHHIATDIPSYEVMDQCGQSCILHQNQLLLIASETGIPLCGLGVHQAQDRCTSATQVEPTPKGSDSEIMPVQSDSPGVD